MSDNVYVFVWDDQPEGGCNDLYMVCENIENAIHYANLAKNEFENVHIMNADGDIILIQGGDDDE